MTALSATTAPIDSTMKLVRLYCAIIIVDEKGGGEATGRAAQHRAGAAGVGIRYHILHASAATIGQLSRVPEEGGGTYVLHALVNIDC